MIPKVFHRIFLDEPVPESFEVFWKEFQRLHPKWEFVTWDDSSRLTWMRTKDLFDQCRTWAGRSDLLRLEIMLEHGGVYVDTDVEPLRPFDPLLRSTKPFAGMENDTLVCPTVLGAEPGHEVFVAALDHIRSRFKRVNGLKPNFQTGPVPLTHVWKYRKDVRTLPREAFYPVGWWEKDKLGGPYPEESYSVHHWNAGWKRSSGLIHKERLAPAGYGGSV